jgi:hypothetical protein
VFQIIESTIDTRTKYIVYSSFIGVLGIYCCGLTYFFEFRGLKSTTEVTQGAHSTRVSLPTQSMHQ